MSNCGCNCHDEFDEDEEVSEFECPDCKAELDEKGLCITETCDNFECDPFDSGAPGIDEQKWERQQMGITS